MGKGKSKARDAESLPCLPGIGAHRYFVRSTVLTAAEAGTAESRWDYQLYVEVFTGAGEKVCDAGFCYSDAEDTIRPCDDYDAAITVDEDHRGRGIALAVLHFAEKASGRRMVESDNLAESTPGGLSLWRRFLASRR